MTLKEWIREAREACREEALAFLRERGFCSTRAEMETLQKRWPHYVSSLFDPDNPNAFYASWTGEVGASNIPTNIDDQFSRDYFISALAQVFGTPSAFRGRVLDYGSGTAAVSLAWHRTFMPTSELYLADVPNLSREFVEYRILTHGDARVTTLGVDLEGVGDNTFDAILCIDVLEHLPNPSEVFLLLHRKLRRGGVLFLQAPWGGHPEHLNEAPEEWARNGGEALLNEGYLPLLHMAEAIPLSGVLWRRHTA